MSSYTSDKYQLPIFRDCPRCKKSVSSDFSYCPHCGCSLIKPISDYIDPRNIRVSPLPKNTVYVDQIPIKMNINTPEEYCSHCGQRIVRPNSLQTPNIYNSKIPNIYDSKIPNIYNSNNPGSSTSSSCFIATACNADVETLYTFYNFRDEILLRSPIGKKLVQFYYRFSPGVARLIQKSEMLQSSILFGLLKPLAALLKLAVFHSKEP